MQPHTIQTTENRKVKPSRDYLTASEVTRLIDIAKKTRYGRRDATLILITFRHGLRASEAVNLKWDQVDLKAATLHVNRLKGSDTSVHYLEGDEVRMLRELRRNDPDSAFIFCSERGGAMTGDNFLKMLKRLGKQCKFGFDLHPHMLRHATGYALANSGADTRAIQHYLGHKNIQHTVRYTKLSANRFKGFGSKIGGSIS